MDFSGIEKGFSPDSEGYCTESGGGMVATQATDATEAGVEMLKIGGNAIDAAIAAALSLCVCEPQASGLGGQTMILIHLGDRTIAVDGSSRAPSLAHPSAIYQVDRKLGYRATTVPSTPAALGYIHEKYGKLDWKKVIGPAIGLALEGYPISKLQSYLLGREKERFESVPSWSGLEYFYRDGEPYSEEEIFRQPDLAKLLKTLSKRGYYEFYRGKTARVIDADMRENGGLLRYDDLALIPLPIERTPLVGKFRGLDIHTMPPPGSGRTLLFTLSMLDEIPQGMLSSDEMKRYLIFIHIIRRALVERSDRPYEPEFFPQMVEDSHMLDPSYARRCLDDILKDVDVLKLPVVPTGDELTGETTHLSVMDGSGMTVSLTQSIERVYGSKAAAGGLGFLYNNYICDFEYKKADHPFYLRPNVSPWATVAPTIVFDDGKPWMALGSPGSERIISTLALFLLRILDQNISMDIAMKAPRLHCSLGGRVSLEANRFPKALLGSLKDHGFRIDPREDYSFYLGCIQGVLKRHDNGHFQGVADIRRDGKAMGV